MPEMKRNFTAGKMNKDLDERLVPPGEYRDALNVQVSSSEDSDIGTIQNVLGNASGCFYREPSSAARPINKGNHPIQAVDPIMPGSKTIGYVSDEANDTLYWLVASKEFLVPSNLGPVIEEIDGVETQVGFNADMSFRDVIMRTNPDNVTAPSGCQPVFIDNWGYCVHNQAAFNPSGNTNKIFLRDENGDVNDDMYLNIKKGMTVTGHEDGSRQNIFTTKTIGIGSHRSVSTVYQSGVKTITTSNTTTIPTTAGLPGLRLRSWDNNGGVAGATCNFVDPLNGGYKSNTAAYEYPPLMNEYQFWYPYDVHIRTPTGQNPIGTIYPPPNLVVGSTVQIRNLTSGNNIGNPEWTGTSWQSNHEVIVEKIELVYLNVSPCIGNNSGNNTQRVYLITVSGFNNGINMGFGYVDYNNTNPGNAQPCGVPDPATGIPYGTPPPSTIPGGGGPVLGPPGPNPVVQNPGCTDPVANNYDPAAINDDGTCAYCDANDSQLYTFEEFEAEITSPGPGSVLATNIPNNAVIVDPNDVTVSAFLNEAYNASRDENGDVISDLMIMIDNNIGAGHLWPLNSCIELNSLESTQDNSFAIVKCTDPSVPQDALSQNNSQLPLFFNIYDPGFEINSVLLSDDVDLSSAETICFKDEKVLNFNPKNLITGINVVDDMLFWTDNFTEPKKINIKNSVAGTNPEGNMYSSLVNTTTGLSTANKEPVKEEHITVIKKSPKHPLSVDLKTGREKEGGLVSYAGIVTTSLDDGTNTSSIVYSDNPAVTHNFSPLQVGDTVRLVIEQSYSEQTNFLLHWSVGSFVLLKEFVDDEPSLVPLNGHTIRAVIKQFDETSFYSTGVTDPPITYGSEWTPGTTGAAIVEIEITSLNKIPPGPVAGVSSDRLKYVIDLEPKVDAIFKNKFPRFSYRYKYESGEYSTFAPWSEVAFSPGNFGFDPTYGFNTGMVNHATKITLRNFAVNLPLDVVELDILYKEEGLPNCYIVETINPLDYKANVNAGITSVNENGEASTTSLFAPNPWYFNRYEVTSETIKSAVASNQLLRPWDSVPTKALAQEVTGSRIVYANYEQNYNLNNYKPEFRKYITSRGADISSGVSSKSIKSLREYNLGVVFVDKYGRETPILVSESGGFEVKKDRAKERNKLIAGLAGSPPSDMEYFKFFIKETSTEYYNLAMDRWYNAEDGNIWIAFPSSDRNKVDIDTTLLLKKGDSNVIENEIKYKILAIENEAPTFIKTRKVRIGSVIHNEHNIDSSGATGGIFGSGLDKVPFPGGTSFTLRYNGGNFGESSLSNLEDETNDLFINFETLEDGKSPLYKIAKITSDRGADASATTAGTQNYYVTLDSQLRASDMDFIFDVPSSPSKIKNNVRVQFTVARVEEAAKFDGRFFVKVANDGEIKSDISGGDLLGEYIETQSNMVYLLEEKNPNYYSAVPNILFGRSAGAHVSPLRIRSLQAWAHPIESFVLGSSYANNTPTDDNKYLRSWFKADATNQGYPTNWITLPDNGMVFGDDISFEASPNSWNVGQEDYRNLNARQAFFGKIPLHPGESRPANYFDRKTNFGKNPSDRLQATGGKDDKVIKYHGYGPDGPRPRFEGVWFIDKSFHKYVKGSANGEQINDNTWKKGDNSIEFVNRASVNNRWLWWFNDSISQPNGITNDAEQNSAKVELSFGGFGYNIWTDGDRSTPGSGLWQRMQYNDEGGGGEILDEPNFFDIGSEAMQPIQKGFVDRINAGLSFKWKEDPSGQVYTITGIETRNVSRFDKKDGQLKRDGKTCYTKHFVTNPANYIKNYGLTVEPEMKWNPAGTIGTALENGLKLGYKIGGDNSTIASCACTSGSSTIGVPSTLGLEIDMTVSGVAAVATVIPKNAKDVFPTITAIDHDNNEITISEPAIGTANVALEIGFTVRFITSNVTSNNFANWTSSLGSDPYIVVDFADSRGCQNNEIGRYGLHKGMRLSKYNGNDEVVPKGDRIDPTGNNVIIKSIGEYDENLGGRKITLTGYTSTLMPAYSLKEAAFRVGDRILFEQVTMNSVSNNTEYNTDKSRNFFGYNSGHDPDSVTNPLTTTGIGAVGYRLQMMENVETYSDGGNLPQNPYVWETEPKKDDGLDVYYEISENNPINLNQNTLHTAIPVGSSIRFYGPTKQTTLIAKTKFVNGNVIYLADAIYATNTIPQPPPIFDDNGNMILPQSKGARVKITRPSGVEFEVQIEEVLSLDANSFSQVFKIKAPSLFNSDYHLNWHNCYSFGNGVESNRIKDSFNLPFIINGVKASTTLDNEYKQERRKHGLIYSGIYNSNSGVNNLNQFIAAENITKDLNPSYGSIQKLHAGWGTSGDLIALCEDRVLKILANKDALFNADGNSNVTATNKVLGTATPYAAKNGISKNPESFASHSYRAYFTDKVRGKVMRLSKDGLTPISDAGMKTWFKDNLKFNPTNNKVYHQESFISDSKLIGSYDDRKQEYNLTIQVVPSPFKTLTYREDVKGWVSFKSFVPEGATSCNNEYYSFLDGKLWVHHAIFDKSTASIPRNNFYGIQYPSSFKVILNDAPSVVKSFYNLSYEGSQSKVDQLRDYSTPNLNSWNGSMFTIRPNTYSTDQYYNAFESDGWFVRYIKTDIEEGSINEFIKKEDKWFNYIKGKEASNTKNINITQDLDTSDNYFQGLGRIAQSSQGAQVDGCTDPTAFNYVAAAFIDDGSCIPVVNGCLEIGADNYDPNANTEPLANNGSCIYLGCTNAAYMEFTTIATHDDGSCATLISYGCMDISVSNGFPSFANSSTALYNMPCDDTHGSGCVENQTGLNCCCISTVLGCIDPTAFNYSSTANYDDGSCIPVISGCATLGSTNYDCAAGNTSYPCSDNVNTDDGSCFVGGCTDPSAINYSTVATQDDGSCISTINGCTDSTACNYDSTANVDDGSCILPDGCTDSLYLEYDASAVCDDGSCTTLIISGCTDPLAFNYVAAANVDNGTCIAVVNGCTDPTACNYDINANTDDGSCDYSCVGCTDPNACNYDTLFTISDNSCIMPSGCSDPLYVEYDSNVTCDDNTNDCVTLIVNGCTDPNANNYDTSANTDDGSCAYTIPGCTNTLANNYNPNATVDDGSCTYNAGTAGCMDPVASPSSFCSGCTVHDPSACVYDGVGLDSQLNVSIVVQGSLYPDVLSGSSSYTGMHGTLLTTPDTSLCSSTYGCQGQFAMTIGDLLELSRLQVDPSNLNFYGLYYTPPTPSQPNFGTAIVPAGHLQHWRCIDNCGGDPTSPPGDFQLQHDGQFKIQYNYSNSGFSYVVQGPSTSTNNLNTGAFQANDIIRLAANTPGILTSFGWNTVA